MFSCGVSVVFGLQNSKGLLFWRMKLPGDKPRLCGDFQGLSFAKGFLSW
jgi:hypothetical protein